MAYLDPLGKSNPVREALRLRRARGWAGNTRKGLSGLGFRVQGLGFRVQGLGFRVWGLGRLPAQG